MAPGRCKQQPGEQPIGVRADRRRLVQSEPRQKRETHRGGAERPPHSAQAADHTRQPLVEPGVEGTVPAEREERQKDAGDGERDRHRAAPRSQDPQQRQR